VDFITPTIKPSIDALKSILGAARRKWGKRKYEKLLAATISELLKEHPDLTAAEANLAAAEAAGATPDVNLLRAKSMYGSAHRFHRAAKFKTTVKARRRGAAAKKAPRRRKRRTARIRKI
jgi:hypothetical protein